MGKTTLTIAIADTIVSELEAHCAIVDLDPQASATHALISDEQKYADVVQNDVTIHRLLRRRLSNGKELLKSYALGMVHRISGRGHVDCDLYANGDKFWDLEFEEAEHDGGNRLQQAIRDLLIEIKGSRGGRIVIIDCPPGQSQSALAAIRQSDLVLCPITPDRFAIWGKDLLSAYIQKHASGKVPRFVVSRARLTGNQTVQSMELLARQEEMLMVETGQPEHGVYGRLAPFSERAIVLNNLQVDRLKTLDQLYGAQGALELRNIVNAIKRELEVGSG